MLKQIARVSFLAILLVGLIAPPSEPGGHGGGGGGHGGGGGSWGHGGGHHHNHGAVVVGVGVGAWGWGWGWPWWGWPGPYWPYPYGYYPPVVNEPVTYIQGPAPSQGTPQPEAPPPPTTYWYYCPSAHAYYPQTATCDEPWVKVPQSRE